MRKFLLLTLLFLVLAVFAIVIGASVAGRPEFMVVTVVPAALFLLVFIGYGVAMVSSITKQRHQGMEDAAERLGFSHSASISESLRTETAGFVLMEHGAQLLDEIRGEQAGLSIRVLTLRRDCGGEGGRCYYTAALLSGRTTGIPDFTLRPVTIWDRIRRAARGHDIHFQGSRVRAAFFRQFVLRSLGNENEQAVRDLFDEPLMVFFLNHKAVCLQVTRDSVMVWREPSVGHDLARGLRSVRANIAEDVEMVVRRAMDIHAALLGKTHSQRGRGILPEEDRPGQSLR